MPTDDKSDAIDVITLYLKVLSSMTLIMSFILTPENNFPGLVTVVPLTLTSEIPLENFLEVNTALALKLSWWPDIDAVCWTDLSWSIVFWVKLAIVNAVSIPLTISFSPVTKVPEVWLRSKVVEEEPETTKPLAPLLFPFIKADVKSVVLTLKITFV